MLDSCLPALDFVQHMRQPGAGRDAYDLLRLAQINQDGDLIHVDEVGAHLRRLIATGCDLPHGVLLAEGAPNRRSAAAASLSAVTATIPGEHVIALLLHEARKRTCDEALQGILQAIAAIYADETGACHDAMADLDCAAADICTQYGIEP